MKIELEFSKKNIYQKEYRGESTETIKAMEANYFLCLQVLILSIREVATVPRTTYSAKIRLEAIEWFKTKSHSDPLSYYNVCSFFGINASKLWLQIRRWIRVNPEHLLLSLKSVEALLADENKTKKRKNKLIINKLKILNGGK